jgi:hypothetical protein
VFDGWYRYTLFVDKTESGQTNTLRFWLSFVTITIIRTVTHSTSYLLLASRFDSPESFVAFERFYWRCNRYFFLYSFDLKRSSMINKRIWVKLEFVRRNQHLPMESYVLISLIGMLAIKHAREE